MLTAWCQQAARLPPAGFGRILACRSLEEALMNPPLPFSRFAFALACVLASPAAWSEPAIDAKSLAGRYDNAAQVKADGAVPHAVISIEPTREREWTLWSVHVETDATTSYDQTWAMQSRKEYDGSSALIPYYQLTQDVRPDAATFTPDGWLSLEACALRGPAAKDRIEGVSEGEPCVAVSMSVGARRALLPVGFVQEGDLLHVDLNLRGARTRIDAKR
jgi:hypothetical protein